MKRTFKDRIDFTDALDHIKAKLIFMADACVSLCGQTDGSSEQADFGMQLIFDDIVDQIDDVSEAFDNNIYEVVEGDSRKVSATG